MKNAYSELTIQEKKMFDKKHKQMMSLLKDIKKNPDIYCLTSHSEYYDTVECDYEDDYNRLLQDKMKPAEFIAKYLDHTWDDELEDLNRDFHFCQNDSILMKDFIDAWATRDDSQPDYETAKAVYNEVVNKIYAEIMNKFSQSAANQRS